ncbi:MAG: YheT family hydrolase [Cyclobacteriaceae bacterium]
MPVHFPNDYRPPAFLLNPHLETIVANTLRKVNHVIYQREKFYTSDDDFLLLDWMKHGSNKLIVLAHGLEGNSEKPYMKGLARIFYRRGWDVLAWNCRSCGGEMNQQVKLYHHGEISDLSELMDYITTNFTYEKIAMAGVSMGGSIILKYLGVMGSRINSLIKAAVAISTPCDLADSEKQLRKPANAIYRQRFFKKLWHKIHWKAQQFIPEALEKLKSAHTFTDLHHIFTLPVYGFSSEKEFYQQGSAINFLSNVEVPTLIINAQNDPMLFGNCYPINLVQKLEHIFLEIPAYGGHAGFLKAGDGPTWSELRASRFINSL